MAQNGVRASRPKQIEHVDGRVRPVECFVALGTRKIAGEVSLLRQISFRWAAVLGTGCVLVTAVVAGVRLADFPLRVHIYTVNQHSHYSRGMLDSVDGEGRANLFENGEARGFDYAFRCGQRLMTSAGYETYPARWKKPGKELEMLRPVMGRPDAAGSCVLKVDMKNGAYFRHNGLLEEEPVTAFKEWMAKHEYDPEHGKNEPVNTAASANPAVNPQ